MITYSKILKLSLYNTKKVYYFYKIDKEKEYTYSKIKNMVTINFYEVVEKISNYLYFDIFNEKSKDNLKNKEFKLLYNDLNLDKNVVIQDGIIFAKSHFDVKKINYLLQKDNLLIIIPENIIEENDLNKIQFLKWNSLDKWWCIQNKKFFLKKTNFKPIDDNQLNKNYVL